MSQKSELNNLPCCGPTETVHVKQLPHLYGFDFDLYTCLGCGRSWVYALSTGFGSGRWEWVSESEAETMLRADEDEYEEFMHEWARRFDA